MELALDAYALAPLSLLAIVSILVFVELALDGHFKSFDERNGRVSILVFVELALDVQSFLG